MIRNRLFVLLCAIGLVSVGTRAIAIPRVDSDTEKPAPKKKTDKKPETPKLPTGHQLMKAKLKSTQQILEALALNDFKRLEEAGEELAKITTAAEFLNAYKSPEYELQMATLRREALTLAKKAREKNSDGATLAYMGITMTCVKCHQHTRDDADALIVPKSTRAGK